MSAVVRTLEVNCRIFDLPMTALEVGRDIRNDQWVSLISPTRAGCVMVNWGRVGCNPAIPAWTLTPTSDFAAAHIQPQTIIYTTRMTD